DAERELADVLRVAQHLADARVHPAFTSAAARAGRGDPFRVQLLGDHRVAMAAEVQSKDATDYRRFGRVHYGFPLNHGVAVAAATCALPLSMGTAQPAPGLGAQVAQVLGSAGALEREGER